MPATHPLPYPRPDASDAFHDPVTLVRVPTWADPVGTPFDPDISTGASGAPGNLIAESVVNIFALGLYEEALDQQPPHQVHLLDCTLTIADPITAPTDQLGRGADAEVEVVAYATCDRHGALLPGVQIRIGAYTRMLGLLVASSYMWRCDPHLDAAVAHHLTQHGAPPAAIEAWESERVARALGGTWSQSLTALAEMTR